MIGEVALSRPMDLTPQTPSIEAKTLSPAPTHTVEPVGKSNSGLKTKSDSKKGQTQTAHTAQASKPVKARKSLKTKTDGPAFVVKISTPKNTATQNTKKISISNNEALSNNKPVSSDKEATKDVNKSISSSEGSNRENEENKVWTTSEDDRPVEIGFKNNSGESYQPTISQPENNYDSHPPEETIPSGLSKDEDIDLNAVQGDPRATIDKMNKIRRSVLIQKEPSKDDVIIALRATNMASKAHRELLADKTSEKEEHQLASEKTKKKKEPKKSDTQKETQIQSLPDPSRFKTPMAGGSSISSPRFSKPEKSFLNKKAMDPTNPLGSSQNFSTIQQRNIAKAFSTPKEAEPLLKIQT